MPINQGCSWNASLVSAIATRIAAEARAIGVDTVFAPVVNMNVDPRFGRFQEGFSENPALTAAMGAAAVAGLGIPLLLGYEIVDAATIAVELTAKNGLLGFVVLASAFRQLEPSVPLIVYSGVSLPLAALVLVGFRLRLRREVKNRKGGVA